MMVSIIPSPDVEFLLDPTDLSLCRLRDLAELEQCKVTRQHLDDDFSGIFSNKVFQNNLPKQENGKNPFQKQTKNGRKSICI